MKQEKPKTSLIIFIFILCIASLFVGITIGTIGTINILSHAAVNLFEGTDMTLNFDLNETKLVNQMYLINKVNEDYNGTMLLT